MQDCQVFLVIGGSKRPIRNYSYFMNVDEQAQNVHGVKNLCLHGNYVDNLRFNFHNFSTNLLS